MTVLHAAEDVLVHKDDDHPTWMFGLWVTDDEKYLIMQTSKDTARVSTAPMIKQLNCIMSSRKT